MASNQGTVDSNIKERISNTMVGFLGGGRMAQAMAKGFISSGEYKVPFIDTNLTFKSRL